MSFSLQPAEKADVPALSELTHEVFKADRHTQFKSLPQYGGYNHGKVMVTPMENWIERPSNQCRAIKAVDDTTSEIIGFVVWGLKGSDQEAENSHSDSDLDAPVETAKIGVERLKEITDTAMQRWKGHVMPPGTKCMYIVMINVSSAHQGQGVGSALIRYGTELADRNGVFCWVSTSEAGVPAFKKHGFEEIWRLDVDLDEFAQEENEKRKDGIADSSQGTCEVVGEETHFGVYTFRYMKRLPRKS